MNELASLRGSQRAVQHEANRRACFHARQAACEQRIIRQHRADTDQNGVALGPQQLRARLRHFSRDRNRPMAGASNLVVARDREFQDHMWTVVADAPEMSGVIARGLERAEPDIDPDSRRAKFCMPLACYFGIGILDRRHHARNPGGDHGVRARGRLAEMRTGLERDIERGAARRLAGPRQRFHLGMGTAARLSPAAADDDAVLDDDGAHRRIGPGPPQATPAEYKRKLHEAQIGRLQILRFLRELLFQNAEDHLRNKAIRVSSSPESSPSTASKSLASRKLRYTDANRT